MTLPQYLDSLTIGGASLVWNKGEITQSQLAAAGGKPYVEMRLGSVEPARRLHQGWVLRQLISLNIFVEPTPTGGLPSASLAQELWGKLFLAPESVNEGMYGRDFIRLEYAGGFSPDRSEESSGLRASVRFRHEFTAALTPA